MYDKNSSSASTLADFGNYSLEQINVDCDINNTVLYNIPLEKQKGKWEIQIQDSAF